MKVYRECDNCGNILHLIPNVLFNLSCQRCGCYRGKLVSESENEKLILLRCECGKTLRVNSGEIMDFVHEVETKRHKLFKILNTSSNEVDLVSIDKHKSTSVKLPGVTAIVTCHNNLYLTKDCIQKLSLSSVPCKIILIDNDSLDDTEEWARGQKYLKYIRNKVNWGCGIARNQGAKWATTEWLLFLDNDQFVKDSSIRELLEVGTDIAGTEVWYVKNKLGHTEPKHNRSFDKYTYIGAGGMLIKRSTFDYLGGFDERYSPMWYEDVDFSFRARQAGILMGATEVSTIQHIVGGTSNNQKTYNSDLEKENSRKIFIKVWENYLNDIQEESVEDPLKVTVNKPRVLLIVDFPNWAWDNKAKQIKKYLSNDFDIDIIYFGCGERPKLINYDLCFTFECNFVSKIPGIALNKILSGVTAHTYVNMPGHEFGLSRCKATHANSRILYNEIKGFNSDCFYVPNGVDEELFSFYERDITKPFTACYVGKPNPRKGLDEFIIPACEKAGVILKNQTSKVNFVNRIDHKNMPDFYKDVDVVMIASDMDGTPNQLLEAASVGRTFIGNPIGNVPEFVDDGRNGFMIPVRDVDLYAEKLIYLKNNRNICQKMGENARLTVEQGWTWKIQAENYRIMFNSVLGKC